MTAASESTTPQPAGTAGSTRRSRWLAAGLCAVAGFCLFQFFGNATRGYVDTSSTFWWWISQWVDPGAETEHGWVILAISGWLLWRNLRRAACGEPEVEGVGSEGTDRRGAGRAEGEVEGARINDANERGSGNVEPRRPRRGCGDEGVAAPFGSATSVFTLRSRGFAAALAAMMAGLGLHALGFVAQQTRISIIALLLFTWGVLRLGGGRRWGDAAMFPLAFLIFAIPVNVLDSLGFWLRMAVVDAANVVVQLVGIDVVHSGTQLFAPDGSYQYDVAAACSGVRSLMALAALSLLIGYLSFRSWPKRALIAALCLPLTYVGNLARVLAIIFAAELGGQPWGERAHEVMGFGVFVIVLGGVAAAARVLQRRAPPPEPRTPNVEHPTFNAEHRTSNAEHRTPNVANRTSGAEARTSDVATTKEEGGAATPLAAGSAAEPAPRGTESARHLGTRRPRRVLGHAGVTAAVAALVVALSIGEAVFLAQLAAAPGRGEAGVRLAADGLDPVELPAFIGTDWIGRRAEITAVERAVLPADTGYSRRSYVHLQGAAHTVFLSIVLSGRDRTSIHRPELCLVGQGWTIRDQREIRLRWRAKPPAELPATLLRTERVEPHTGQRMPAVTVYWFVNRDTIVASHWGRFWRDAWNRVRHGRADRWAYVLLQADAADGEEAALARVQNVLAEVWPHVRAVAGENR